MNTPPRRTKPANPNYGPQRKDKERESQKKEKRKHKKYMIRMILEAEMVC